MVFIITNLLVISHIAIAIVFGLRIISRQPPTGVALAWLLLVAGFPFIGAILYLMIGERRIGTERSRRFAAARDYRRMAWQRVLDSGWGEGHKSLTGDTAKGMAQLGWKLVSSPAVMGSVAGHYSDFSKAIEAMVADIDKAKRVVLLETYIWQQRGAIDDIKAALIRAVGRGVDCRVLVDAIGGAEWFRSGDAAKLSEAGIKVGKALPVGFWRNTVGRADLRLHRKCLIVDNICAWTGSMNMVDPRFFKQNAGVGEWVDAMVRLEGAIVAALATTAITDWAQEDRAELTSFVEKFDLGSIREHGNSPMQAIPSGPGASGDSLLLMLNSLIAAAHKRLIITTPYFVPDDSIVKGMRAAAGRGVKVTLILPRRIDSTLVRYASRSFYTELLKAGIEIQEFTEGLLHTKSITVDDRYAMFGSVNMDYRSLYLNFEIAVFFYGTDFTKNLVGLQQSYIDKSEPVNAAQWQGRSRFERFKENLFRLVNPLL